MKISSFPEMIKEYDVRPIDTDDLEERERLTAIYKYSVIFEGCFWEYDNALNWVKDHLNIDKIDHIFYGKLGYDYGYFEFFLSKETDANEFTDILPDLFTKFPDGSLLKTDGYSNFVGPKE